MNPNEEFQRLRPRLFGMAYRMLGGRADAEDVVQDAWLRWHAADHAAIATPEAWLVTVATRLAIDRLRALAVERNAYVGPWLPEPLIDTLAPPAEAPLEQAGDISTAYLMLLERLGPEERAIFLLHEVFEFGYPDIAQVMQRSEDACRKALQRARERVRGGRQRFRVERGEHLALLARFVEAARSGDRHAVARLCAPEATFTSDGGGVVTATLRVIRGADRIGRLYEGFRRKQGERMQFATVLLNGEPGLLTLVDGRVDSALSFDCAGGRIEAMYLVRNPRKLRVPEGYSLANT
jgi:RNA polymerase sigma-70 factor (ECF subfamily)